MPLYSFDPLEAEISRRGPRTSPPVDETSIQRRRRRVSGQAPSGTPVPMRAARRLSRRAA
jgi:hypothetical protein